MRRSNDYLVFTVEGKRCALPLAPVQRVVRAAEITALPNAPEVVLGILDIEGAVFPVLSLRRRFQLPERALRISDQFVIAEAGGRNVVLVIDEAVGVSEIPAAGITEASQVVPGVHRHLHGVATLDDGLVLIHDLHAFLSLEESTALDDALRQAGGEA